MFNVIISSKVHILGSRQKNILLRNNLRDKFNFFFFYYVYTHRERGGGGKAEKNR